MFKSGLTAAVLLALPLASCVTGPTGAEMYAISPEVSSLIRDNQTGGIVADLGVEHACTSVTVSYRNLVTGQFTTRTFYWSYAKNGEITPGNHAAVIPVRPGTYMLTRLSCFQNREYYTQTITLDAVALWMRPFVVEPGKIVYAGTPRAERIRREFGIELTFPEKLSGRTERSSDLYNLYEIKDESERVLAEIRAYVPELADRFSSKPTPSLFDKEVVRKIINDAYDKEAGEVAPDDAAAARNRKAARDRVMQDLRAYAERMLKESGDAGKPAITSIVPTDI